MAKANKKPETKPAPKSTGKGAMAKEPSTPPTSKRGNWQFNGQWVDKEGYKVDGYGKRLGGQSKPLVPAKQNPFAPKASAPTTQGPAAPAAPTPQEQIQGGMEGLVREGIDYARDFDPNTFQGKYEPQFEQGMQRAYDTIYGQFERKNQDMFAQQNQQLQQSLVERGLDPNSPAYQALTKQLAEQQSSARQSAQDAAWQAAQGYQQQGFQQATGTALLPSQIASPYLELYGQQQGLTAQQQEAQRQRDFEEAMRRGDRASAERIAQMSRGGGGGGNAAANAYAAYEMNQYQQPQQSRGQSTLNAGVAGAAQGIGTGITRGLVSGS
jgi:hypothetical protein